MATTQWNGCERWLDPAWNPQSNQETITSATPETDDPCVLPTSKDDE
jgi:hypothetical protein